jgi:hypothetical protein
MLRFAPNASIAPSNRQNEFSWLVNTELWTQYELANPQPMVTPERVFLFTLLIRREASAHLLRGSDRLMQSFTRCVYNEISQETANSCLL